MYNRPTTVMLGKKEYMYVLRQVVFMSGIRVQFGGSTCSQHRPIPALAARQVDYVPRPPALLQCMVA